MERPTDKKKKSKPYIRRRWNADPILHENESQNVSWDEEWYLFPMYLFHHLNLQSVATDTNYNTNYQSRKK